MIKNNEGLDDVNAELWNIYLSENICNGSVNVLSLLNEYCEHFNRIKNSHFLLDINKEKLSFLEKIIYDMAMFHFEKLKIKNLENKFVSFWFRSIPDCCIKHYDIHIDSNTGDKNIKDEDRCFPLITTLTYLCEHENPTIITDITQSMNNNKKYINTTTKLTFSFPKPLKHVSCDFGKYYHGECHTSKHFKGHCSNINEENIKRRNVLAFALWDKYPGYRNLYNETYLNRMFLNKNIPVSKFKKFLKDTSILKITERNEKKITIFLNKNDSILNTNFYENIINNGDDEEIYKFSEYFERYKDCDTFIFRYVEKKSDDEDRYYNIIFKNIFSLNICNIVINNYNLEKNIKSIIELILFSFNGNLFSLIAKCVKKNINFTINNVVIIKNECFLKPDENSNQFKCLILLDETDEINNINKGDVILNVGDFTIINRHYVCYSLSISDNNNNCV